MNRKIPVILVLMLLTGSLVNAHSPHYSEKLRLGHKKIFSRVMGESGSGNTRYNKGFPYNKATTASGTLTNPYGNVTHYGYDGYDRISKVTDPLNNVTLIGRANAGNLLSLKQLDATGQQILLQSIRINDPAGRLKSYTIKMPNADDDITYTRIYEDNGKRIIFKDPLERQTVVQLNDDGKVDTVTDAAGNVTKYYYEDGRGNATKKEETVKSADGNEDETKTYFTEYKYNAHNQVETITDLQTQAVTTFTYDLKGNLTGTIDAEGNTITHKYDELGRRIKTEQHFKDTSLKPVETTFEYYPVNTKNPITGEGTYSPSNRLKFITDDKGNKTIYEYDNQNRLKKVIYPDDTYTEYTYDINAPTGKTNAAGKPTYYRVVEEKQRNDTKVKHYYDELQRLMKREITPAEGSAGTTIETFTYDELSRVKHAADDDTTLDYQFDRASRMDWENQAGKLIDYTYNKVSNLTDLKYPNTRSIERQYDQLNRMNLIKEGDFDLASMIHIGRSYRLLSKQYGNGDLITYLYDQGRRLEYLESKNKSDGIINHYRYGYNKINLKTFEQRLHNVGKADVYGYDPLYRLTNVKFNVPGSMLQNPTEFEREKSINHDNLHNTISIIESFNGQTRSIYPDIPEGSDYWKLNQVARFDQWGLEYDKNGNLKQKGTQRYTHDYRNQLISAVDGTLSVEMKYDVMGRRVQKSVTQGSQTKVRNYYYSGYQLIEERDGNDQVTRQYIYGNGIDEIIRMDKYQGTVVTSYYFHTDSIGSITAITDSQGNLVERVTYDVYGMPTFWDPAGNKIPESLIGNTILFQGREYDPELNLYYYRARYYDPIMGRFLETDPMGYADSMNLYQGFNMNPANFVDPTGTVLNLKYIETYGSSENLENVVKSVYAQFRSSSDTHATAYKKLIDYGFVIDKGSKADEIYEYGLAGVPSLGVFDVTPAQFGKDVAGGLTNAVTSLTSLIVKGLSGMGGYNPYVSAQIDKAQGWVQGKINKAIGANEGSLGYFVGETYGPAVAGGWLSAELECLNATAQTEKTLSFLGTEPYPLSVFSSKAPYQVTQGTRVLEGQYIDDLGRVQPWRAYYDEYGRLIARNDYNAGNVAESIPANHYHTYEWGAGKTPLETGKHIAGEYKQ